jgi:hypothetical protein
VHRMRGNCSLTTLLATCRAPAELYAKESITLPNGSMQMFLMTAITEEELQFGMHNRALDLYHRLRHSGKAYISDLDRPSVPSSPNKSS